MPLQILVADDDEIVLMIHTTLIKKSELGNPLTFTKVDKLLEYLLEPANQPVEYLLFLDINMPEMNAWEFLDRIESEAEKLSVVIVTSSINKVDKEKAAKYTCIVDFIEKPMRLEDCEKIKSLPCVMKHFSKGANQV